MADLGRHRRVGDLAAEHTVSARYMVVSMNVHYVADTDRPDCPAAFRSIESAQQVADQLNARCSLPNYKPEPVGAGRDFIAPAHWYLISYEVTQDA
jgi:hypothetical protein